MQRLRGELSNHPAVEKPPVSEVWPIEDPSTSAMAQEFVEELAALQGEVIRCASMAVAREQLSRLVHQAGWNSIGAMDRPSVHEAAGGLAQDSLHCDFTNWTSHQMAELAVSVVEADLLLADTGSCMVACPTRTDRLLCYLPPACVVVARESQLCEHIAAAWTKIAPRVADPSLGGEFVLLTGPSRTADIEKILILGVHGPKRLVVLLVEE